MSVQVSKKKQVIFGLIVLVLILVVLEAAANVWWLDIQNCSFEDDEIFAEYNKKAKRQLCEDLYNLRVTPEGILSNQRSERSSSSASGSSGRYPVHRSFPARPLQHQVPLRDGSDLFPAARRISELPLAGKYP